MIAVGASGAVSSGSVGVSSHAVIKSVAAVRATSHKDFMNIFDTPNMVGG
jgi:hypothetical protein